MVVVDFCVNKKNPKTKQKNIILSQWIKIKVIGWLILLICEKGRGIKMQCNTT